MKNLYFGLWGFLETVANPLNKEIETSRLYLGDFDAGQELPTFQRLATLKKAFQRLATWDTKKIWRTGNVEKNHSIFLFQKKINNNDIILTRLP
jgi:hypothetical protein